MPSLYLWRQQTEVNGMQKIPDHLVLALILLVGLLGSVIPATAAPRSPITTTVRVVSSNRAGITLELTVPGVTTESATLAGQRYDALAVPGCTPATEPGRPALPRKSVLLGIPPGANLHVTATVLEAETLPGAYRVAPAPRWVVRPEGEARQLEPVYEPDAATYASESPYPAEPARIARVGHVRSQRVASLELTPFRYRPASGELRLIRRLRVRLGFRYPDAAVQSRGTTRAEEPSFEGILSRSLLNYETARTWRALPPNSSRSLLPASCSSPWSPPDPAWKVLVNRTGLYRLTYADLQTAGVPVDTLDPRTLRLYNQGTEVAVHVAGQEDASFDDGDTVEFYGQALDTRYTDTNVYWLTYGGAVGQRMTTRDGTPAGAPTPVAFTATARIEENHAYWASVPTGDDHWFWQYMRAISPTHSVTEPLSVVYTGTVSLVATDTPTCTVGIFLYGATSDSTVAPDHHAIVYLNDHLVAETWWDGQTPYSTTVEVPQSYLTDIANTFRVDMPADTGSSYDGIYVNRFTVEYGHPYRALGDELAFTQDMSGTWQYRLTDFTTPDIRAFDVTDPAHVVRLTGGVPGGDASYFLRFQDTVASPTQYLVLAASRAREPVAIVRDTPSYRLFLPLITKGYADNGPDAVAAPSANNSFLHFQDTMAKSTKRLADPTNQADYVIIVHDDLYTSTLPLAAYWQSQGMMVQVVRVSDVYDEFAYGIFDPTAIRDFLAYAYANWQDSKVAYVLLVGDGTYDYWNYQGFDPPPGVPPYLVSSPYVGETGSDNWYACVSGDDYLPDLHIGRLPAASAAEADLMVSKILNYTQNPPTGTWNQAVLFVADNADSAGDFAAYSDVLVDGYLPSAYTPERIYLGDTYPYENPSIMAHNAIITATNAGCLLVNYIGHGAVYLWAGEKLLYCYGSRCDFDDMDNGGKLPFVVSMTCMDGYYIHPDPAFISLAERWLLRDGGGAVATFAATGLGLASGHDVMNRGLFTAIFTDTLALGPATTEAKFALGSSYRDLVETYHLFGDPALPLHLP